MLKNHLIDVLFAIDIFYLKQEYIHLMIMHVFIYVEINNKFLIKIIQLNLYVKCKRV